MVGTSTADDAAVYKLDDGRAIVQTVDLITPIVDDPFVYGQIAAANSLSDVYAMGGRPLFALSIVCFPSRTVGLDCLAEILRGGHSKAQEAGIAIIGGHSVEDQEPKYGLVVTGIVAPEGVLTNVGAQPGDVLVLTKPIGTGILTTALKKKQLNKEAYDRVVQVMTTLNRAAAEALEGLEVHALTDVTGFGLLGHLSEMVTASGVAARIDWDAVPLLSGAAELVAQGIYPGGTKRNLDHFGPKVQWPDELPEPKRLLLADAQTSGGLLISLAPSDRDTLLQRLPSAKVIGEIQPEPAGIIQVAL